MSAPIPSTVPVVVPPSGGATYDRWGVPRLAVTQDEATGVIAVALTAVRGDALTFSPRPADRIELAIPDLLARFAADPEALAAIQAVMGGLLLLAGKELTARGVR